ncbi:metal-dependent phosphohydrolase, HD subdomain protein [Catellatospora methionotrophica]|uniref:Metal-dependent phosphohydrolase, HD subdomain protein n=1 Tax=Catellatospora methionotrophica TaxID=121620 RepID=A0A8J3LUN7_9ACTN|nr:HD domain-containing protein [Catellatospora methionotrophica]GIG19155.1 metal-dependent phosphohydrolase, HD subdomain protein [Catellatospora methionotrophica]
MTIDHVVPVRARWLAEELLADLPQRRAHSAGVAGRAAELSAAVSRVDRDLLLCAAWLHDVGYAAAALDTGFHPLDGARLLRRLGWPPRLCALVAHHSGAAFLAQAQGVPGLAEFPDEASAVTDALASADQTAGVCGEPVFLEERLTEALGRHGASSAYGQAHLRRAPYLRAAAARVQSRLLTLAVA